MKIIFKFTFEEPVHCSARSHTPEAGRHSSPADSIASAGQELLSFCGENMEILRNNYSLFEMNE